MNRSTPAGPQDNFVVSLPAERWTSYHTPVPNEKPPLPPGPYNDTNIVDGLRADGLPGTSFTHHLIRDFMFLDAAANNNIDLVSSRTPAWPTTAFPYDVVQIGLDTSGNVGKYTQGDVHHSDTYNVLDDTGGVPDDGSALSFESRDIGFTALLYELRNSGEDTATTDVPNWFGVAVPDGITDFRNVIIYFHPNPLQQGASYSTLDYQDKSGAHGTNWKELFAYVERLGKQLAGAAKYSAGGKDLRNQVVIVPFMKEYDKVGVFPKYWPFIVLSILDDLYAKRGSF